MRKRQWNGLWNSTEPGGREETEALGQKGQGGFSSQAWTLSIAQINVEKSGERSYRGQCQDCMIKYFLDRKSRKGGSAVQLRLTPPVFPSSGETGGTNE